MALINKLKAIGDAIRAKTGKTDELTLDQMVTEIEGISGGDGFDYVAGPSEIGSVYVGNNAFLNNNRILSVNIRDCTEIGLRAFMNASSLKTVRTIASKTSCKIHDQAFENCTALEDVSIQHAWFNATGAQFYGCINLKSANFEVGYLDNGEADTMPNIGIMAFGGCEKLETINNNGPLYCKLVLEKAFALCASLKKIWLVGCEQIFTEAFYGCTNLRTVILDGDVVCQVDLTTFNETPMLTGEGHIYVPTSMYESYRAGYEAVLDQLMPGFFDILFRKIEDYPEICGESAT